MLKKIPIANSGMVMLVLNGRFGVELVESVMVMMDDGRGDAVSHKLKLKSLNSIKI